MIVTQSKALEEKKKLVVELASKIKESKTVLIASIKNLPSSQFHKIKKDLRGKVEIRIAKKSIILRAIHVVEKGAIQNLKNYIAADVALFFSNIDTFDLSRLLYESQSPTKAKSGDIAPDDITVEPGPTELVPGPAISELSGVGLKVAVEGGKLSIKQGAIVAKKGTKITENVAGVLGKLNIMPMMVGFIPIVAYDAVSDKLYENIKIDVKATLEELRRIINKSLGFAFNINYTCKETISFLITKAATHENALKKLVNTQKDKEVT